MCVCVCTRKRVRESERDIEKGGESKTFFKFKQPFLICFLVADRDGEVQNTAAAILDTKLGRFVQLLMRSLNFFSQQQSNDNTTCTNKGVSHVNITVGEITYPK